MMGHCLRRKWSLASALGRDMLEAFPRYLRGGQSSNGADEVIRPVCRLGEARKHDRTASKAGLHGVLHHPEAGIYT